PSFPPPKLRPPLSARAMTLPGATVGSPTAIASESATPGPAPATTIALPRPTAVTSPEVDTAATVGSPLVQVASEGDNAFPAMSLTAATSCTVLPGDSVVSVAYPGVIKTDAGAVSGATVRRRVSAAPWISAATRATPPAGFTSAVTAPLGPSRMSSGFKFVRATGTPATRNPAESTLIRITNEPAGATVVSCGATVTRHPARSPQGPTYATGTESTAFGLSGRRVRVSLPVYTT